MVTGAPNMVSGGAINPDFLDRLGWVGQSQVLDGNMLIQADQGPQRYAGLNTTCLSLAQFLGLWYFLLHFKILVENKMWKYTVQIFWERKGRQVKKETGKGFVRVVIR